ncbi:MAG: hypothetical protein LQ338_004805 [Usnochroma carphineum]|nr:MAG: hypothetical protein LQ338_004805 [Usnochroma carphineum]
MNALKSYVRPNKSGAKAPPPPPSAPIEMGVSSSTPSTTQAPGIQTAASRSGSATPKTSRPASLHPSGDFRNQGMEEVNEIKCVVAMNWVYQLQNEYMWNSGSLGEGVVMRKAPRQFIACPPELTSVRGGLFDAAAELNAKLVMTVNTKVINLILQRDDLVFIQLKDGLKLQILPNIAFLPTCQKYQNAAFVKDQAVLIVWADSPKEVLARAAAIEEQMMWVFSQGMSPYGEEEPDEKKEEQSVNVVELPSDGEGSYGMEEGHREKPRPIHLTQAIMTGLTLILVVAAMGSGWRQMAIETAVDNSYLRWAFLAAVPAQIWLALFFMQSVVGCAFQLVGPTSQMVSNSKFYSGVRPRRLANGNLPHVTIQCPVYKEGLYSVIDPTMKSLKAAIATYEMQGGTANIFVNDDGMQLIPEEDAQIRREYYEENRIGWVARPKHNPKPADGETQFIRAGKFKKASNMNYAMAVSARVEEKLVTVKRGPNWNQEMEAYAFEQCLQQVKDEDQGRTWAEGNIRIGDYILLIDSDTRVPQDCFLDAVSEMEASPQVAILQYASGVMNVTTSFFENGITFFTNLIYTAIKFAVANGDVAPFVGHNAVLRWSALQDIAYTGNDGTEKYWSETTVSEDFDMALRLQCTGYIVRMGGYTGGGFKEGVSLTVYDELARWEKYAYGCNELIFHPIRYWFTRGPFTPLFRKFIGSNMPLPSKVTIMAYVGTYYAIGSAWILTMLNYFLIGWFNGRLDHYYVESFKIYFAIVIIFSGLGNVALAVLRYRLDEQGILRGLITNFKWILLLTIFLGGISLHVSQALLCHMFSIDMSWGATAKEVENTSFFEEVPKLIKKFKFTFIWCFLCAGVMIFLAVAAPPFYTIKGITAVWPLTTIVASHFLLPIVLNPSLMLFTF